MFQFAAATTKHPPASTRTPQVGHVGVPSGVLRPNLRQADGRVVRRCDQRGQPRYGGWPVGVGFFGVGVLEGVGGVHLCGLRDFEIGVILTSQLLF